MTLQNHSSLQPGPFPGAGQPGLRCARPRACLPNTRPPTSQSAPGIAPSQPARTSVLRAAPRRLRPSPVGGQAPRAGAGPPLLPRPWSARPAASTCGASPSLVAACAPGTEPVPVRTLPQMPSACRSAGPGRQLAGAVPGDVGIRKRWWYLQRHFLFSFFFCSHGWCAFYDFREVFLCSRKCKCHA